MTDSIHEYFRNRRIKTRIQEDKRIYADALHLAIEPFLDDNKTLKVVEKNGNYKIVVEKINFHPRTDAPNTAEESESDTNYTPVKSGRLEIMIGVQEHASEIYLIDRSIPLMTTYAINSLKEFTTARRAIKEYVKGF